jgi:hypothetical protein
MLKGLFSEYATAVFMAAVLAFAIARVVSSGKNSRRREKPDPVPVFGPIRGMYVCYQCDTIFNTAQCPYCREEASIPLIHLTGSLLEDERVSVVTRRIDVRAGRNLPALQNELAATAPATALKPANGDGSGVPVRILFAPERGRELS